MPQLETIDPLVQAEMRITLDALVEGLARAIWDPAAGKLGGHLRPVGKPIQAHLR